MAASAAWGFRRSLGTGKSLSFVRRYFMFIGHFAVGFAAKPLAPKVSLGSLFLAAQFLDLLWPTLLLLGIERVRIAPGATQVTPLIFEHYPISHSLLAVLAWGALAGALYFFTRRDHTGAIVIGSLVISHWVLDAVVHQPDLQILPGGTLLIGLGIWRSLPLTLTIELSLFLLGISLYARTTTATDPLGKWALSGLILFLFVIYVGNLFGSPPPSTEAIAWVGQLQWFLVLWGYWIEKHRQH